MTESPKEAHFDENTGEIVGATEAIHENMPDKKFSQRVINWIIWGKPKVHKSLEYHDTTRIS